MNGATTVRYDGLLLYLVAGLAVLGTLVVASAGISLGGDPWELFWRRLVHLGLAMVCGVVMWRAPLSLWRRFSWLGVPCCIVLLLLPLAFGVEKNGAMRWIHYAGISFQPSELAKAMYILYLAHWCATYQQAVREFSAQLIPVGIVVVVVAVLLKMQSDHGSIVVLGIVGFGMLFLSGAKFRAMLLLVLIAAVLLVSIIWLADGYVGQRLSSFRDLSDDPTGSDYQVRQSLFAHGLGGWWGVGLGNGLQKQAFLPDAHTDFIFSVFVEEFGAIAGALLVLVFFLLVARILWIGYRAERSGIFFGSYMAYGIGLLLAAQLTINFGGSLGVLPLKGLTLMFFSHGGSNVLVLGGLLGLVLRIDSDTRVLRHSGRVT